MKVRALGVLASGLALVLVSACGGRVDDSFSGASSGSVSGPTPQLPPTSGSSRPGRPPPSPATPASVAAEIAEAYCKGFSSCCVGTGQPPIDVARCRQLVAADVQASVDPNAPLDLDEVGRCVDTIKGRIGVCSSVDAAWWTTSKVPLLAPSAVVQACAPLLGGAASKPPLACTSDSSCIGLANRCALDECVTASVLGGSCSSTQSCLDGPVCIGGICSAPHDVMAKGPCATDDDCRLGLVCAKSVCLPARDFPELARPRFSPYRIGADTCRAYTYL